MQWEPLETKSSRKILDPFHVPTAQLPGAGRCLSDNRPRKRSPENGSMRQELKQSASHPAKDTKKTMWYPVNPCSTLTHTQYHI